MKKWSIILLLMVGAMPLIFAQEENVVDYSVVSQYEIGGITVSGTQFLDEKVLISLSGLKVGDAISIPGDDIPKAIKNLWKQGLFADVEVNAEKIVNNIIFLKLHLKELPRLSKYRFDGIKKSETEDLRDRLSLISGRIVNDNIKNNAYNEILEYYHGKGFLNAKVDLDQSPDPNRANNVILIFNIQRGRKVKIDHIKISGNNNAYARNIKKALNKTKEKTRINPLFLADIAKDASKSNIVNTLANISSAKALNYLDDKVRLRIFSSSKFIEEEFKNDKQSIVDFYHSKGYRDARVVRDSVYFKDNRNLQIELDVEEGNKYYFGDVVWKGNSKYKSNLLSKILGIKKGDVYNGELLNTRLFQDPASGDVSSLYMDDGYLFFNVTPVETRVYNDTIDLEMRIYEGPQATINKVTISGNDKTNEHVIRRELRTLPGSKFSRTDIIRSQREIANLGFFNPETIGINPKPNPSKGTVDIEYSVEEKPSDQLELSAGWGGGQVVGSIGVSFNNFSLRNILKPEAWSPLPTGDGQKLSFRFYSTGRRYQSINASFTEPWLGGKKPNSLSLGVFHSRQLRFSNLNDGEVTSKFLNTGVSVSLGRRLRWPDDNFTLVNSLNFNFYDLRDFEQGFIVSNGKYYNISFNTTLSRTSINQPIYPTSGSNFSLSVELTPPYSLFDNRDYTTLGSEERFRFPEYHKWKFKAEWFTRIVGNLVLRTSIKTGFMGYYNDEIGYAPFERFDIGGDGLSASFNLISGKEIVSLRGYEEGTVTNNQVRRDDGRFVNVGDPFFNKFTLELRYPFSTNPSSTIYALMFVEGGNSWNDFKEYNPFAVKRSAGLGIRIFLPMFGTLGFDYGVGFDNARTTTSNLGSYLSNYGRFSFILGFEPE